ncbi:Nucleotide-binding protein 1 [Nocardioides sp. PD653]|nr:Nucleotide-binding protein 1 [Nocardioides sp. PD653-B2]GAW54156.1 Nucleotide-binding protein 1 [Nocardioides sp. PD653]
MLLPRRDRLSLIVSGSGRECCSVAGKSGSVVQNSYPQAEGYSYVNLAVLKTLGSAAPQIVTTRRAGPVSWTWSADPGR